MSLENPYPDVGGRIAQARGRRTQAEFAAQLGVDRKTVVRWEQGERLPDGASLLAMWREFQIEPSWLISGAGAAPQMSSDELHLLAQYRRASAQGQRALEAVAAAVCEALQGPDAARDSAPLATRLELHEPAAKPAASTPHRVPKTPKT